MPVNNQFSIAVHLMAGMGFQLEMEFTSSHLAASVNTSASFVRRTIAKLSRAKLVKTTTGKSGSCSLAKKPEEISLLEIYKAVEAPKAFAIHDYPERRVCPVSCGIKASMSKVLERTQKLMEAGLAEIKLSEVIADL